MIKKNQAKPEVGKWRLFNLHIIYRLEQLNTIT